MSSGATVEFVDRLYRGYRDHLSGADIEVSVGRTAVRHFEKEQD